MTLIDLDFAETNFPCREVAADDQCARPHYDGQAKRPDGQCEREQAEGCPYRIVQVGHGGWSSASAM